VYIDGELRASTPAVPSQDQWCSFIHQFGLASKPRDTIDPNWTSEHQEFHSWRVWQPNQTPAGQGIVGGGIF
jgi:hypothetical protein